MWSTAVLTVALSWAASSADAQEPLEELAAPGLGPATMPENTNEPPSVVAPPPEEPDSSMTMNRVDRDRWSFPNRPLVITGSSVLVAAYVPAVIASAVSDEISNKGYYPVAGPWMEIAQESNTTTSTTLLAIDGVLQGLGALALVSGFVIPERKTRNWYLIGNNSLVVTPHLARNSAGIGAFGRF
jgi:hypothetical protein